MVATQSFDEQIKRQRREAEERDAKRRAEALSLPYLDLVSARIPTELRALAVISETEARATNVVPLSIEQKKIAIAALNPRAEQAAALIETLRTRFEVTVYVVSETSIAHGLSYYQYAAQPTEEISGSVIIDPKTLAALIPTVQTISALGTALTSATQSTSTSHIIDTIIAGALTLKVSDVHLEANATAGAVRLRIDGLLHTVIETIPNTIYHSLLMRIKLLSNLKMNVKAEPQDGRFTITLAEYAIEVRTSIIPSEYGETVVLRILDPRSLAVDLATLGWRDDDLAIVTRTLEEPNGLILNTGPTGSGKTTTLYAFLKKVFRPTLKIITIEDPVEYHLPGISQTQVDPDAGYTFASGLRSILRQDPNIVLVGEIRDTETAGIAMNAALTGHLVFSTLHTNDAVGAIPRLLDLGAEPHVVGPALKLVIAQRLVRRLCTSCRKKITPDVALDRRIEHFIEGLPARVLRNPYHTTSLYEAVGCEACGGIGYRGRISLFELFFIDETIEELIYKNPSEIELARLAREKGMTTMQEDGALKAITGITTIEEVERVTGPISWFHTTEK